MFRHHPVRLTDPFGLTIDYTKQVATIEAILNSLAVGPSGEQPSTMDLDRPFHGPPHTHVKFHVQYRPGSIMSKKPSNVEAAYDGAPEREWGRLSYHRLEFEIAKRNLYTFLPSRTQILDTGGGPGRYAIALAQQGHLVTLSDLSRGCLELARQKAQEAAVHIQDFVHADARDMGMFNDEAFEAVLCMGPVYHMVNADDREQIIRECMRVLTPGGLLFVTFITSYAPLMRYVRNTPGQLGKGYDPREFLPSGVHEPNQIISGLPDAFFIHPSEVQPVMERFDLETLKVTGLEGIVMGIETTLNALPDSTFAYWVDLMYETAVDPVTWGSSEHILYIGRKHMESGSAPSGNPITPEGFS